MTTNWFTLQLNKDRFPVGSKLSDAVRTLESENQMRQRMVDSLLERCTKAGMQLSEQREIIEDQEEEIADLEVEVEDLISEVAMLQDEINERDAVISYYENVMSFFGHPPSH